MKTKTLKTLLSSAAVGILLSAMPAAAMDVTLTTLNKDMVISGELIGIEGTDFIIETSVGTMRIASGMVSCEGTGCPVEAASLSGSQLDMFGSSTVTANLMPTLLMGYGRHANVGVDPLEVTEKARAYVLASGNANSQNASFVNANADAAFAALLSGDTSFAITTRPANSSEIGAAAAAGIAALRGPQHEHVIGYDGLLLVAHPESGMDAISEATAAQIFAGKITNWAQLGGDDAKINVYVRENGSGARSLFDSLVMRSNRERMGADVTALESDEAVAMAVKADPYGFGFTSMVYAASDIKPLEIEGVCGLRTPVNAFTIKTGEYPLTRPLYLYSAHPTLEGHAKAFVDYMQSEDGQRDVVSAGFVGQSISTELLNAQGNRVASTLVLQQKDANNIVPIRNMLSMLMSSERLSTTVRFTQGGNTLDASAQADVSRLGAMLSSSDYAKKQFYFMGFSDSVGRPDLNQLLALQRAELVRNALLDQYPELKERVKVRSVGFGEISPLGCNETRTGRSINRRVEVWMQDIATKA